MKVTLAKRKCCRHGWRCLSVVVSRLRAFFFKYEMYAKYVHAQIGRPMWIYGESRLDHVRNEKLLTHIEGARWSRGRDGRGGA